MYIGLAALVYSLLGVHANCCGGPFAFSVRLRQIQRNVTHISCSMAVTLVIGKEHATGLLKTACAKAEQEFLYPMLSSETMCNI